MWDEWNYATEERSATPCRNSAPGQGRDCEDHAIMKHLLLRHLDVPAENLLLAVGQDSRNGRHMVVLAGEVLPLFQAGNREKSLHGHAPERHPGPRQQESGQAAARRSESAPYQDHRPPSNEKKDLKKGR